MYHHLSGGFAMDPRTVHRIAAHRLLRTSAINSSNCCLSATLPVVQSDWISGEDPEWRMPYQRPASETTRLETSLFKPYRHYSPPSLFPSLSVCLSVYLSLPLFSSRSISLVYNAPPARTARQKKRFVCISGAPCLRRTN
jgi:hypothetical protein